MSIYSLFANTSNLESDVTRLGIRVVLVSAIALFLLVLVSGITKHKQPRLRLPLFLLIAFTVIVSTLTLFGSTIYLNTHSESGGPVHWHADFEIWACGNQLELRNPSGFLSNKIGTPSLHEHDDQRIHVEGVLVEKSDASLGHFMNVVGGSVSNEVMNVPIANSIIENQVDGDSVDPTNVSLLDSFISTDVQGQKSFIGSSGQKCGDKVAMPQVFVYRFDKANNTYSQTKLTTPSSYIIRDESEVPPGDCIIMEFAAKEDKTNKLCEQYGIRDQNRCAEFGVSGKALKNCNIHEVAAGGQE